MNFSEESPSLSTIEGIFRDNYNTVPARQGDGTLSVISRSAISGLSYPLTFAEEQNGYACMRVEFPTPPCPVINPKQLCETVEAMWGVRPKIGYVEARKRFYAETFVKPQLSKPKKLLKEIRWMLDTSDSFVDMFLCHIPPSGEWNSAIVLLALHPYDMVH